ncbi:MAG: translocation/assembly module TamB domain-containing protein [Desulfocapsaceae bacterium]
MTGGVRVDGTLAHTDVALSMTTPADIQISGRIENLLGEATWDLVGSAQAIELTTISPDWPAAEVDLDLITSGRPAEYRGSVQGKYSAADQPPIQVDIDISGDQSRVEIVSALLSYNGSTAGMSGTIDVSDTLAWDASASINELDLSSLSEEIGLKIDAELHSTGNWSNETLAYEVKVTTFTGTLVDPDISMSGNLQLQGDGEGLDLTVMETKFGDGLLQVRGRLGWVDELIWQADVALHDIDPALLGDLPQGSINAAIASDGLFSTDDLSIKAVISSISGELAGHELEGGGSVSFQQDSLKVTDVHLRSGENSLQLNGYVADNCELQLIFEGADLSSLHPMLGGRAQISSSLTGPRSEPIVQLDVSLTDFSYDSHSLSGLTGAFEARLTEDLLEAEIISAGVAFEDSTAIISGNVSWREGFAWDNLLQLRSFETSSLGAPIAAVVDLDMSTSGQWSAEELRYRTAITEFSATTGDPPVILHGAAQLEGDDKGLTLTAADLQVEDGKIKLTGKLDWSAELLWEARLLAEGIDPHLFESLPEGNISAEVSSSGKMSDDEQRITATIHELSGTLAGYELEGGGSIGMNNNSFETDGLYIQNGGNLLQIKGVAGASYGLDFIIEGNDLNRLHQSLDGNVEIAGRLSGTSEEPVAQINISARDLSYADSRLADLSGDAQVALGSDQSLHASLLLEGFTSSNFVLDQLNLKVVGTLDQHQITLNGLSPYGDLTTGASGQVVDRGWWGVINDLHYRHQKFGSYKQRAPSSVAISADRYHLDSFCLDSGDNSVCVEGEWQSAGPWRMELSELRFELAELNKWGVMATALDGELSGHLSSAGAGMIVESVNGKLNIPELNIDLNDTGPYKEARWFDTSLSVELNESILETTVSSRFVDESSIDGNIIVEGFRNLTEPFSGLPLRGNLVLDIKDLSPLQTITGDYLVPTGHVMVGLTIDGLVGKPELTGDLDLQGGGIQIPELGSVLNDMTGSVSLQGKDLFVRLDGACGEGEAQASGEVKFGGSDWQGVFQINGRNCKLLDLPEMVITASPELDLVIGSKGGSLKGKLLIPRALIKPELMSQAKSESADVVFTDDQGGGDRWPFIYQLSVELGEDISIDGFGLSAVLGGNLAVSNTNKIVTGRGVLKVEQGSFTIYGKPLKIHRGRLTFTGGPIDNPLLDIDARKVISTNQFGQEEIVVGVNIIGTVADYEIELFSRPLMEDREIIAYILFDKSFDSSDKSSRGIADSALQSFGVSRGSAILGGMTGMLPVDDLRLEAGSGEDAALVVGRSLTDQLSLSYDFNLLKNSGTIRVRYEFGKGFSVQSRNSFDSNSIELLYSFER